MPAISQIRSFNLKVIFLTHFVFIALSSLGYWATSSYLFYNFVYILLLVWSIYHHQNEEPIQLAIVVNGVSIVLDILLLIMCWPYDDRAREKFSAAMAILHLIIRPFSIVILIKTLEERSGSTGALTDLFGGAGRNESYEDIDRSAPPQTPASSGGYTFDTAQPI